MNNLIDTHLDINQTPRKREFNGLLLAAYLLCTLGMSLLNHIVSSDIHSDGPSTSMNGFIMLAIDLVCILGIAVLNDFIRQGRVLNLVGIGLFILLGIISWSSNIITGYAMAFLYNLAAACITYPLLRRLLAHTEFFGRTQKTILLSIAGSHLFTPLFFQIVNNSEMGYGENPGMLVTGMVLLITALILIVADKEEEDKMAMSMRDYVQQHPRFWTHFILPFIGVVMLVQWASAQPQRAYFYEVYINKENDMQPLFSFLALVLGGGLLTLLVLSAKIKNQWIYIGIGSGLLLIAILVSKLEGEEWSLTMSWTIATLSSLGITTAFFGTMLWMYQHTTLPFLTALLAFNHALEYIVSVLTNYFNLHVMEMHMHHFRNF